MPAQKHCVLCSCCRNKTLLHGFDKVSQSVILVNFCYTAFQFNLARGQKVGRLKINLPNLFSWVFVTESACFGFLSFSIWPWHWGILRQILRSSEPFGTVLNFCGPIILYLFLETFYHFRWYFYSWLDFKILNIIIVVRQLTLRVLTGSDPVVNILLFEKTCKRG